MPVLIRTDLKLTIMYQKIIVFIVQDISNIMEWSATLPHRIYHMDFLLWDNSCENAHV